MSNGHPRPPKRARTIANSNIDNASIKSDPLSDVYEALGMEASNDIEGLNQKAGQVRSKRVACRC